MTESIWSKKISSGLFLDVYTAKSGVKYAQITKSSKVNSADNSQYTKVKVPVFKDQIDVLVESLLQAKEYLY